MLPTRDPGHAEGAHRRGEEGPHQEGLMDGQAEAAAQFVTAYGFEEKSHPKEVKESPKFDQLVF